MASSEPQCGHGLVAGNRRSDPHDRTRFTVIRAFQAGPTRVRFFLPLRNCETRESIMKLRLLAVTAVLLALAYATPLGFAQDPGGTTTKDQDAAASAPSKPPLRPALSLPTPTRSNTRAARQMSMPSATGTWVARPAWATGMGWRNRSPWASSMPSKWNRASS